MITIFYDTFNRIGRVLRKQPNNIDYLYLESYGLGRSYDCGFPSAIFESNSITPTSLCNYFRLVLFEANPLRVILGCCGSP